MLKVVNTCIVECSVAIIQTSTHKHTYIATSKRFKQYNFDLYDRYINSSSHRKGINTVY